MGGAVRKLGGWFAGRWRTARDELYKWWRWRGSPRRAARRIASGRGLTVEEKLVGRTSGAVFRVVDPDKNRWVLKLEGREGQVAGEVKALNAWQLTGLLPRAEPLEPGVLLLEEIDGMTLIQEGGLKREQAHAVASLLTKLHDQAGHGFPDLWGHVTGHQRTIATTWRIPPAARRMAAKAYERLDRLGRGDALLHGDLHAANVLMTRAGARAVDPYGLRGDPAYDVAFIAATSANNQEETLIRLAAAYDRELLGLNDWFQWIAVYRLDNAIRNALPTRAGLGRLVDRLVRRGEERKPLTKLMLGRAILWRRTSIVLLLVIAGLVVLDFTGHFWTTHSMIAALVSSAVFIAVAAVFVDAWTRRQEAEHRWRISNISHKGLARSAVVIRDGLVMFLEGKLPYPEDPTPQAEECARVAELLKPHKKVTAEHRLLRLDQLLQDPEWVKCAYGGVRTLATQAREDLARWSPVMISTTDLAIALNQMAMLADALEDLHRPLGPAHRPDDAGIADPARRAATAQLWDELLNAAVIAEEEMARSMGRVGWSSQGRELMNECGVERLRLTDPERIWNETAEVITEVRDRLGELHPSAREAAMGSGTARDRPGTEVRNPVVTLLDRISRAMPRP